MRRQEMRRFVIFYGKTRKGMVVTNTSAEAVVWAFEEFGKHRRDRVKIYVYAVDLVAMKIRKR
tara:strand:- start:1530 stop:1718 length:189 start_codon:yes stop_codon:yes gene_type:complete